MKYHSNISAFVRQWKLYITLLSQKMNLTIKKRNNQTLIFIADTTRTYLLQETDAEFDRLDAQIAELLSV